MGEVEGEAAKEQTPSLSFKQKAMKKFKILYDAVNIDKEIAKKI